MEMRDWLEDRPKWMQTCVAKILRDEEISEEALNEFLGLCKMEAGIPTPKDFEAEFESLPAELSSSDENGSTKSLISISELKGINALAPKKPLCFKPAALTIVYGRNGSGKSGYVRALKKACGARDNEPILKNVYGPVPEVQGCRIEYTVDDNSIEKEWNVEDGRISDLSEVSVYDSKCGNLYVTDHNSIEYQPGHIALVQRLIDTTLLIREKITNEIEMLNSSLPGLPDEFKESEAGLWFRRLDAKTNTKDVDERCDWTEDLEKKLVDITKLLSDSDVAGKVKKFQGQADKAKWLGDELQKLLGEAAPENCSEFFELRDKRDGAKKAASEYGTQVFGKAEINGVGSETWKKMWEHARAYSLTEVYPEKDYPNTSDRSVCVLCHQELSEDAKKRLISFEEYTKSALENNLREAEKDLETHKETYSDILSTERINDALELIGIDGKLKTIVVELREALEKRKTELFDENSEPEKFRSGLADGAVKILLRLSKSRDTAAKRLSEETDEEHRDKLEQKRTELAARKWCAQQKEAIKAEVERLGGLSALKVAKKLTETAALTNQQSRLSKELITEEYIARFGEELSKLDADELGLILRKVKAAKGRIYHAIELENAERQKVEVILSEGEFRIVSLAAFLANVQASNIRAPFIFDDPISSLDQEFEQATVGRLIELAKDRQVIVFTHRLSLLSMLETGAKGRDVDIEVVNIKKEPWGCGEPSSNNIYAQRPDRALNLIIHEAIPKAQKLLDEEGTDAYELSAKAISGNLRILIERIVEEDLLIGIVTRFSPEVKTKEKLDKLHRVTEEDCAYLDDFMTEYSRYEHAQPQEVPVKLPGPDKLEKDAKKLAEWLDTIRKRNKAK